ncbi:hypothetical protein M5K25_000179 [Dendrobium thyrsiflorum]|uniref:Uncharacterized protein n=1 Tax=Dendrobium thyrsiflorum TaxID=117978 RepID=A0ABD0VTQ4_DENTH
MPESDEQHDLSDDSDYASSQQQGFGGSVYSKSVEAREFDENDACETESRLLDSSDTGSLPRSVISLPGDLALIPTLLQLDRTPQGTWREKSNGNRTGKLEHRQRCVSIVPYANQGLHHNPPNAEPGGKNQWPVASH